MFFFFKQKTAYDMRISDWSSDVCSSDLVVSQAPHFQPFLNRACRKLCTSQGVWPCVAHFTGSDPAIAVAHDDLEAVCRCGSPSRSEERRVGKECVSTCRSRWSP